MRLIKIALSLTIGILFIQAFTYYTFSNSELVKEIGKNYETAVFDIKYDNRFEEVIFISDFIENKNQITSNFTLFREWDILLCKNIKNCNIPKTEYFYKYFIMKDDVNPFRINIIDEGELAKEFGASWKSKYIWFFYRWILIEKEMTGIS